MSHGDRVVDALWNKKMGRRLCNRQPINFIGADEGNRTPDPLLTKQLLYP